MADAVCEDARLDAYLAEIKTRSDARDAVRIAAGEQRLKSQIFAPHMLEWSWNRLLTTAEAREFLALQGLVVSERLFSLWAHERKGPPITRAVGRRLYDFLALRVWAAVEIERQPLGGF